MGTLVQMQLGVAGGKESGRVICQENRDLMHPVSESNGGGAGKTRWGDREKRRWGEKVPEGSKETVISHQ